MRKSEKHPGVARFVAGDSHFRGLIATVGTAMRFILFFFALLSCVELLGGVRPDKSQFSPASGEALVDRRKLEIGTNGVCEVSLWVDGKMEATLGGLVQQPGSKSLQCAELSRVSDSELIFRAVCSPWVITARNATNWVCVVEKGQAIRMKFDCANQVLDFQAPASNTAPVVLNLVDGARADIGPGQAVVYDLLADGSYLLGGRGGVAVRTSEGAQKNLTAKTLPHAGGPLARKAGGGLEKKLPTQGVLIQQTEAGIAVVSGNGPAIPITANWTSVSSPNGASIQFRTVEAAGGVEFSVVKGAYLVSVDRIPGWTVIGLTGQGGRISFDLTQRVVDLVPGAAALLAKLPGNNLVSAGPGSYVQFQGGSTFSGSDFLLSAVGGQSFLVDMLSGSEVELQPRNYTFRSGSLVGTGAAKSSQSGLPVPIVVSWVNKQAVKVSGSIGTIELEPGASKLLESREGARLRVEQNDGGEVLLQSLAGDYQIQSRVGSGLQVDLKNGESVILGSPKTGTLVVQGGPRNTLDLVLTPASGSYTLPALAPGSRITFISGLAGEEFSAFGGAVIFTEAAGSGRFQGTAPTLDGFFSNLDFSGAGAGGVTLPNQGNLTQGSGSASTPLNRNPTPTSLNQPLAIDISRIAQTPVSGVGNEQ